MRPFDGRHILVGVTGGIASYKTVMLARQLTQAGAHVDVVMTRSAREFVGAVTFEAITGREVHSEIVAEGRALDHLTLASGNELVVVAPATADFLARAAGGRSNDLLSAVLLATQSPVLLVPAMNDHMWAHPQTAANIAHLRELGYAVLDPAVGPLASPEEGAGPGRMREPEEIIAEAARMLDRGGALSNRRVVVTAGPTREPVDPVRFISNRSSGRMGVAIAAAAARRGADVLLITGPISIAPPHGCRVQRVETTMDMAAAVGDALPTADVLIMAAAPADFRVRHPAASKVKKSAGVPALELEATPDILASTADRRKPGCVVVGFALETDDVLKHAASKLDAKGLDFIVANNAREPGAGFGVDTNRVTILARGRAPREYPLMPKTAVADVILDQVVEALGGR